MAKSKRIPKKQSKKAPPRKKALAKPSKAAGKKVNPGVLHLIKSFKLGEDIQACVVVCYTEKKQLGKFDSWNAANAFAEQHKKDKPGHKTDIICKQNNPT